MKCMFCEIVAGREAAHVIWEGEDHLAFLSIYPNTPGFTVVIPKAHHSSYAFSVADETLCALIKAAKQVALMLDRSLPEVGRTAMIFEGYGVDHLHAKLFPMHGTGETSAFKKINSRVDKFFTQYEGYVSSHDHQRADDQALVELALLIRGHNR